MLKSNKYQKTQMQKKNTIDLCMYNDDLEAPLPHFVVCSLKTKLINKQNINCSLNGTNRTHKEKRKD